MSDSQAITLPNGKQTILDKDGWIDIAVQVNLSDLMQDFEDVLDLLSEAATGDPALSDISYYLADDAYVNEHTLRLHVIGDPVLILERMAEEAELDEQ